MSESLLSNSFLETVNKEEISDFTVDVADMALDLFVGDDSIVKDIPFVSTVRSLYRIGKSVSEIHHVRQLYIFMNEINNRMVEESKRREYVEEFKKKDEKERNKELEYIILITSKYINTDKPKYLAILYLSYLDGKMSWVEFASYSEIIERFLPGDMEELEQGEQHKVDVYNISPSLLRLSSLGLLSDVAEGNDLNDEDYLVLGSNDTKNYFLTPFGKKLRECLGFSDYECLDKQLEDLRR